VNPYPLEADWPLWIRLLIVVAIALYFIRLRALENDSYEDSR
jgi:hypothetical protein